MADAPSTNALRGITDSKLVSFAIGQQKKSRFQKAREEQEAKKKQDEIDAAKVYESFVASFGVEDGGVKAFVRGGNSNEEPDTYRMDGAKRKVTEMDRLLSEMKDHSSSRSERRDPHPSLPPTSSSTQSRNKRQLDDLMNEFKSKQSSSESKGSFTHSSVSEEVEGESGSFDTGDPFSTNLYVGNITSEANEDDLFDLFSKYGEINSIKIMWPRSVEERMTKKRNCGFVSFKRRRDADDAREELNDRSLKGAQLMVGWGKAVKVTSVPYVSPTGRTHAPAPHSRPPSYHPAGLQPTAYPSSAPLPPAPPSDGRIREIIDRTAQFVAMEGQHVERSIEVRENGNPDYAFLSHPRHHPDAAYYRWKIDAYNRGEPAGPGQSQYHQSSGERGRSPNRDGKERRRQRSPSRSASRSRSSSRDQRDRRDRKRGRSASRSRSRSRSLGRTRFAGMTGAQIERAKDKDRHYRRTRLSREDFREWDTILRSLDLSKKSIKHAMGFAYDKIDSAEEIVSMIKDRLVLPSPHAAVKIAGLYLLSDLLHNSATPIKNATNYKMLVQHALPEVFESLASSLRRAGGRMSQVQIEDRVRRVLGVWHDWSIFPPAFLDGLEATFYCSDTELAKMQAWVSRMVAEGTIATAELEDTEVWRKKARAAGVFEGVEPSALELQYKLEYVSRFHQAKDGKVPVVDETLPVGDDRDNKVLEGADNIDGEDLDGQPLDDIDGVPMDEVGASLDDIDGVPIESIDGVPIDDIDGVPYDEELDGEPIDC